MPVDGSLGEQVECGIISKTSLLRFEDWNLPAPIHTAIKERGWEHPTTVQIDSIPLAREGRNMIVQAMTGSGKTAAFGIPMLEKAMPNKGIQTLIVTPTRELAQQVAAELEWLQGESRLTLVTVHGGVNLEPQIQKLKSGAEIVIGTPGRVIDLTKQGHLLLSEVTNLVLDEADRMLDMGFFPDIEWLAGKMKQREQTLLFSATFPQEVLDIALEMMDDPEQILGNEVEVEIPDIDQFNIMVGRGNKLWALGRILAKKDDGQVIIFTNTKRMVDILVGRLEKHRFKAEGLHGDHPQKKRDSLMAQFRDGDISLLVATDVASRGLDVSRVSTVINYDLPNDSDSYIHRIGRTGRMGSKGVAWNFISRDDLPIMQHLISTHSLQTKEVEPPMLNEGERDPVRRVQDWDELSDVFGMVPLKFGIGNTERVTVATLFDWVARTARLQDLAIGEITIGEESSVVHIHKEKASIVIAALNGKKWKGQEISVSINE